MSSRILLTDVLFPSKYAKWRLVETKSFIDAFGTDILITSRISRYIVSFTFDYSELLESHSLGKYDLLIFNPNFNAMDIYNEEGFDGTKYNGQAPFDYMFRLKRYREEPVDFTKYGAVYHIFLRCYIQFNEKIQYPFERQFIHLYPGGKLMGPGSMKLIPPAVKLITTQHFATQYLKDLKMPNEYVEVYGGPYIGKDEKITPKKKQTGRLNVCFTSLGDPNAKGTHVYRQLVATYKALLPKDEVDFFYMGAESAIPGAKYLGLLPQATVDLFYQKKIDILLNLDTGKELNGFPLGIEGLIHGVVLFTPDYHDSNKKNGFNFGPELQTIDVNNVSDIITKIKRLYNDRELLYDYSLKSQKRSLELFNYEATMEKTFNFIRTTLQIAPKA